MAVRKRRRRRKEPTKTVEDAQAPSRPRRVRKRPTQPQRRPDLRPIWKIATDIVHMTIRGQSSKPLPFEAHKHKLYPAWRELFCVAFAEDEHAQMGDEGEALKVWTGREVVETFTQGTKLVRNKRFQMLREELELHL